MAALSYATVGSNRLDEAKAFYDALLTPIGLTPMGDHRSGGRFYGKSGTLFGVLGPFDQQPATVGNGSMFGFGFDTRAEVIAFHAQAQALGGVDEGEPRERGPGFFSYFRDLDGNKLCAFTFAKD